MKNAGFRGAALLTFALMLPLSCGGRSRSTPGDLQTDGAGKGSGASSSTAGTKAMPSAGSADPGAGGAAPAGGMASGGMASGGMVSGGGAGGLAGGSGGMPIVGCGEGMRKNAFGFALKDSYFLTPCLEVAGSECLTQLDVCPNQDATNFEARGRVFAEEFQAGGCVGKTYSITLQVDGVVEAKYYEGGQRRNGENFSDADDAKGGDGWYVGGTPSVSGYNVFKITVLEPDGETEVQHYYLNSFPPSSGLETPSATVLLGYEATIDFPGQGVVRFSSHDSNCRANNNCGGFDDGPAPCPAPRFVPNEPGLAVPATYGGNPVDEQFNVVNGAQQPFHAQMVHVKVTNVALKP